MAKKVLAIVLLVAASLVLFLVNTWTGILLAFVLMVASWVMMQKEFIKQEKEL